MKLTYWKHFQYDCTKKSGSPQHQAFCKSYQTLWCTVRTNWSHGFFLFSSLNISAISTVTALVCMQYVTIKLWGKTSTCVQKFTSQFRCSRHRSIQTNGGDRSHVQMNSSAGKKCAECLKQCGPIQDSCLRVTSSGVCAVTWHCLFVCVWVLLAPVSQFCAEVGNLGWRENWLLV